MTMNALRHAFFLACVIGLGLLAFFPEIAMWLPAHSADIP